MTTALVARSGTSHEAGVGLGWRRIAGLSVAITVDDPALAARVDRWLTRGLSLAGRVDAVASSSASLRLTVQAGEPTSVPGPNAQALPATGACRVQRDAERVFLRFPDAHCILEPAAGRGALWLARDWWHRPLKFQQPPWLLSLIWLLREHGRYSFHASAVARQGRGLMIAGDSGSGKSSTALSLIHQGWSWVADDMVLLEPPKSSDREPPRPARLHGLARGFAFHEALAERLPQLVGTVVGDKQFTDIDELFPGGWARCCDLAALLLPRVGDRTSSRLEPLAPAAALAKLLPSSFGLRVGGEAGQTRAQFAALSELVAAVPAYRLHAGRDIFGNGAALETLLAGHGLVFDS